MPNRMRNPTTPRRSFARPYTGRRLPSASRRGTIEGTNQSTQSGVGSTIPGSDGLSASTGKAAAPMIADTPTPRDQSHRSIRQPILFEDHAEVPLTKGKIAIIDLADVASICQYNWQAQYARSGNKWYATTRLPGTRGTERISMHGFLMEPPAGLEVDHWDGDGLNNLRSNLRVATRSQNMANKRGKDGSSSPYKGVAHVGNYWIVQLARKYIGCFSSEEEAARAYDAAAFEKYGEFAYLNFPRLDQTTNEASG